LSKKLRRGNVTEDYLGPLNTRLRSANLNFVNSTHVRGGRHLSGSGVGVFSAGRELVRYLRLKA
jgi:hypothetical protein